MSEFQPTLPTEELTSVGRLPSTVAKSPSLTMSAVSSSFRAHGGMHSEKSAISNSPLPGERDAQSWTSTFRPRFQVIVELRGPGAYARQLRWVNGAERGSVWLFSMSLCVSSCRNPCEGSCRICVRDRSDDPNEYLRSAADELIYTHPVRAPGCRLVLSAVDWL